jgi:hypothetical protein
MILDFVNEPVDLCMNLCSRNANIIQFKLITKALRFLFACAVCVRNIHASEVYM